MSYKHNDLYAMRQRYWEDQSTASIQQEKHFLQQLLDQHGVFKSPTEEDAQYLFFLLPSAVILRGYALGFMHEVVKAMILRYVDANKLELSQRKNLKIQFHFT